MEELEIQLSYCKDTASGPDSVTISLIKQFSPEARASLSKDLSQLGSQGSIP